MARDHARILHRLWTDDDFVALSGEAQRMYMLILSQPTLSYAGVAPYTVRRWTRLAGNTSAEDIRAAAAELAAARFLVIDEDTEEVFVRTYVRHDNILTNPNVAIAAVRAYRQIASKVIRAAWLVELNRLHAAEGHEKAWTDQRSNELLAETLAEASEAWTKGQVTADAERVPVPPVASPPEPPPEPLPEGGIPSRARPLPPSPSPTPRTLGPPSPSIANAPPKPDLPPADAATPRPPPTKNRTGGVTAAAVVAAYVDGATSAGHPKPSGSLPARIGRDAKRLLAEGVDPQQLLAAAKAIGVGAWQDLAFEIQRQSAGRNGRASPNGGGHQPYRDSDDPNRYKGSLWP